MPNDDSKFRAQSIENVEEMKLLSIGVPSFNDETMLQATLTNLMPLVGHPEIEILVSDNNSPDNSSAILETFRTQLGGAIQTYVQTANLGFRGNLGFLAANATGKYIWYIGIGERIDVASIDIVLDLLRHFEPTNLVVSGVVSEELPRLSGNLHIAEGRKDSSCPLYSETISLNILKRHFAAAALGETVNSTGDFWPHIEAILDSLSAEGSSANTVFIRNPLVAIAPNADGWWFDRNEAFTLSLAQIRILLDSTNGSINSRWLKQRLKRMRTIGLGEIVLRSRKNGRIFTQDELRLIQSEACLNLFQTALLLIAHATPLRIFRALSPLAKFL